jgi:hypothetical protein
MAPTAIDASLTVPSTDAVLRNGDFSIVKHANDPEDRANTLGDGNDEVTRWSFDFGLTDPVMPSGPLTGATLLLSLTPRNGLITTDSVCIDGLANIVDPIQGLPVLARGQTVDVTIDLLNSYSSDEILGVLNGGAVGVIPMRYADDSIVSYAQLDLSNSVPDVGSTFALLGLGLAGLVTFQRRLLPTGSSRKSG